MIKDNSELYTVVDRLVSSLRSTNNQEMAERLMSAKSSSCMASEIFGEISLVLNDIDFFNSLSDDQKNLSKDIAKYIDQFI